MPLWAIFKMVFKILAHPKICLYLLSICIWEKLLNLSDKRPHQECVFSLVLSVNQLVEVFVHSYLLMRLSRLIYIGDHGVTFRSRDFRMYSLCFVHKNLTKTLKILTSVLAVLVPEKILKWCQKWPRRNRTAHIL